MSQINFNSIKSIAIIRRNGLGDVLCVLPLILYCKEKMPQAKISLFIDQRAESLIPYLHQPDKIEVLPYHKNKYIALFKTLFKYRKTSFDLAISAKSSPMRLMNFFLCGLKARYKVAYVQKDFSSRFINYPQTLEIPAKKHQALKCLALLDKNLKEIPVHLYPHLNFRSKTLPLPPHSLFISVTNRRVGSSLDLEKYVSLFSKLKLRKKFFPVINCEPQDEKKAKQLQEMLTLPSQVFVTEKFEDLMRLLNSVSCLFIGDGGLMHLAAALNKPQVVLFGGTLIWEWAPLSSLAICLRDEHNVNYIPEQKILETLETIL